MHLAAASSHVPSLVILSSSTKPVHVPFHASPPRSRASDAHGDLFRKEPGLFFFFLCTVNFIIRHIKRVVTYWLAEQLLWLWEAIVKKVEAPTYFIHPCMYSTFAGTTKANARRSLALCFPSEETGKLAASISDVKHFLTEKGGASCC